MLPAQIRCRLRHSGLAAKPRRCLRETAAIGASFTDLNFQAPMTEYAAPTVRLSQINRSGLRHATVGLSCVVSRNSLVNPLGMP